jgi:hypothetical protein
MSYDTQVPTDKLNALTDSMSSAIRWSFNDYKQILTAELALLAASANTDEAQGLRPGTDSATVRR